MLFITGSQFEFKKKVEPICTQMYQQLQYPWFLSSERLYKVLVIIAENIFINQFLFRWSVSNLIQVFINMKNKK